MEGRWGKRVYGTVSRGSKYTRFYLVYTLRNGVETQVTKHQSHEMLDRYPRLYKWTLDSMLETIEERVKNHHA